MLLVKLTAFHFVGSQGGGGKGLLHKGKTSAFYREESEREREREREREWRAGRKEEGGGGGKGKSLFHHATSSTVSTEGGGGAEQSVSVLGAKNTSQFPTLPHLFPPSPPPPPLVKNALAQLLLPPPFPSRYRFGPRVSAEVPLVLLLVVIRVERLRTRIRVSELPCQ